MQSDDALRQAKLARIRWVAVGAICLAYLYVMLARFGLAVIVPEVTRDFALTPADLGLLGAVTMWGYAAVQVPVGFLADTWGPRRTIGFFMAAATLGTFIFANAPDFEISLIGRTLIGLGTGVVYVSGLKALALWFREDRFATLTGALVMVGNFGSVASGAPLALMAGSIGWRSSYNILAFVAALAVILVFVLMPEMRIPAKAPDRVSLPAHPMKSKVRRDPFAWLKSARQNVSSPELWWLSLYTFLFQGVAMSLQSLWAVPYLMDVYGVSRQDASNLVTMWPVGVILGAPFHGFVADRLVRNRKFAVMLGALLLVFMFGLLTFVGSAIPLALMYGVFFLCGFATATHPVSFGIVKQAVPPAFAGTAIGLYNMWVFVSAAVFFQVTGAVLGGFTGSRGQATAAGYQAVFGLSLAVAVLAVVAVLFVREQRSSKPEVVEVL